MFELFKEKLLDGMEIIKTKETASTHIITVRCRGKNQIVYLHKTCAPGRQNHLVHQALCNVMAGTALDEMDHKATKMWLDRMTDYSKWAWEY